MKGATTLVVDKIKKELLYATKVASPFRRLILQVIFLIGATTLVVEKIKVASSYATEVASPQNGATTLVVDNA